MSSWAWLIGAVIASAGAALSGWPAVSAIRARGSRDLNAERYLAWRGRAAPRPSDPRPTQAERRRLLVAGLLATVALFCLVGYFTYS